MEGQQRYQSVLAEPLAQFVAYKRALGRRFETEERQLLLLDRFLVEQEITCLEGLSPELVEAFLASRRRTRPRAYNHLLGLVRRFFEWMVLQEMLLESPVRARPRRETGPRVPVIFDAPLMRSLLELTQELPDWPRAPLRGPTYRMAFGLMYGLGLRVGEVHRLRVGDVDLRRRILLVRESKFQKSRLLPFGPRLAGALREFLALRRTRWGEAADDAPLLTFDGQQAVSANPISSTFQLLMPRLGFGGRKGLGTPRAHDLRHSFAVGTLLRWYREGIGHRTKKLGLGSAAEYGSYVKPHRRAHDGSSRAAAKRVPWGRTSATKRGAPARPSPSSRARMKRPIPSSLITAKGAAPADSTARSPPSTRSSSASPREGSSKAKLARNGRVQFKGGRPERTEQACAGPVRDRASSYAPLGDRRDKYVFFTRLQAEL